MTGRHRGAAAGLRAHVVEPTGALQRGRWSSSGPAAAPWASGRKTMTSDASSAPSASASASSRARAASLIENVSGAPSVMSWQPWTAVYT